MGHDQAQHAEHHPLAEVHRHVYRLRPTPPARRRHCRDRGETIVVVATTFADLEARVRGLESRAQRTEEDVTAIVTTVIETREDVRWLKRAVQALLDQAGITLEPDEHEDG
ncbi:hypothetical protein Ae707Ps1_6125c [Pseudonocardia sp. Ae707_Ps1]|nr:hypothetical protein Ae707Ps1_6125c [Pseudonocardia sp. Ae707_Ps1]